MARPSWLGRAVRTRHRHAIEQASRRWREGRRDDSARTRRKILISTGSNFLCDATPGEQVKMTGPTGKVMLMPEEKADTDYIMVATGTGIAPYRGFIRRLFTETTPAGEAYKGLAWLFLGVANSDALLYDEEWQAAKSKFPDNFRVDYALSREQKNKKGGKMYIQDKVEEYADEIFERLQNGAVMYFCGLKGMMPGIQDMLKEVCRKKGLTYDDFVADLKKKGQWRVEVY